MRLHLLSPVPPARTGTADYLRQLVDELLAARGPGFRERLIVWDDVAPGHAGLAVAGGTVPVRSRSALTPQAFAPGDIAVAFLAGNDFHGWIWSLLARGLPVPVIGVIHDLAVYPLIRGLTRSGAHGMAAADERQALAAEHGAAAGAVSAGFDELPATARYFISGQGITFARCAGIIVHSHYARMRLTIERVAGASLPPVRVARHPAPFRGEPPPAPPRPDGAPFTVGSVGFFSPIKRPDVVTEAFAAFARGLSMADRRAVRLVFIGAATPEDEACIRSRAAAAGIGEQVHFTGYVGEAELTAWQRALDLQVNLRFPSCGETSGTLARAQALGTPVVVSDFAAFREERALAHVPVDPPEESEALLAEIRARHAGWREGRPAPAPTRRSRAPEPASFDAVLAAFERDLA